MRAFVLKPNVPSAPTAVVTFLPNGHDHAHWTRVWKASLFGVQGCIFDTRNEVGESMVHVHCDKPAVAMSADHIS